MSIFLRVLILFLVGASVMLTPVNGQDTKTVVRQKYDPEGWKAGPGGAYYYITYSVERKGEPAKHYYLIYYHNAQNEEHKKFYYVYDPSENKKRYSHRILKDSPDGVRWQVIKDADRDKPETKTITDSTGAGLFPKEFTIPPVLVPVGPTIQIPDMKEPPSFKPKVGPTIQIPDIKESSIFNNLENQRIRHQEYDPAGWRLGPGGTYHYITYHIQIKGEPAKRYYLIYYHNVQNEEYKKFYYVYDPYENKKRYSHRILKDSSAGVRMQLIDTKNPKDPKIKTIDGSTKGSSFLEHFISPPAFVEVNSTIQIPNMKAPPPLPKGLEGADR